MTIVHLRSTACMKWDFGGWEYQLTSITLLEWLSWCQKGARKNINFLSRKQHFRTVIYLPSIPDSTAGMPHFISWAWWQMKAAPLTILLREQAVVHKPEHLLEVRVQQRHNLDAVIKLQLTWQSYKAFIQTSWLARHQNCQENNLWKIPWFQVKWCAWNLVWC